MPVSAATLRRLAALELSAEAMAGVLEIIADMQEHDERRREADARRTATYRSRGGGKVPQEVREEIFSRDGWACVECKSGDHLQCDHVIPVSKGGTSERDNLQTLCRSCNARKKDRIRKADGRSADKSRTEAGHSDDATPDKEKSPAPPKEINPSPSLRSGSFSARAAEDAEFAEFWALYPNKVGKPKARTSFATARRRSDFEPIMDGLRRYIRTKPPDRDWLNPATFLNQERWNDEPAPAPQRPAGPAASRQQSVLDGMAQAVERRMRVGSWEAEADARRRGDGNTGPPDWGGDSEDGGILATGTG